MQVLPLAVEVARGQLPLPERRYAIHGALVVIRRSLRAWQTRFVLAATRYLCRRGLCSQLRAISGCDPENVLP